MATAFMGATNIIVAAGLSNNVMVNFGRGVNSALVKIGTGAGTLSIVTPGFSATQGYALGANEVVAISGAAVFYLSAGSATMTASCALSYSAGWSMYP